ncbi:replication endonuclease [Burkholderia pseudomallei]|uniref:replication endonuclease n=1 Tax=Burkholderia pseudomallei TaxID=28450 RepID=UPI0021F6E062|nr:replication endonuclease [Burkholderia pseudomallei]MCW0070038.1 replication endonuclease [Burkholderia pseudomallei]
MIILNNSTLNVNTHKDYLLNYFTDNILNTYELSYVPFYNVVNEDTTREKKHKKAFSDNRLNKLVPEIHKSYVHWIIKNQFGGNEQAYIETIPLFFEKFSSNNKKVCDNGIFEEKKNDRKKLNKKRRQLILYSSQLLKLVGLNRSSITTRDIVTAYREEIKQQDEYLKSFRLIDANGRIRKLVTNEQKQREKIAQILKISKCFEEIAKDKEFTFTFLTLTLNSHMHCNPLNNNCSFEGHTPQEAINAINNYWKLIRAKLSNLGLKFGDDLFGMQVMECQVDSTLHLHAIIWHDKDEELIKKIHDEIRETKNLSRDFGNQKIILNNGKAKASSYLFKYVIKTHTTYNDEKKDDSAIKNMACRNLYGIRSFNFFGLKGSITKFNFICKHYLNYKKELSKEVLSCLKNGDLYSFVTKFQGYFENQYITEMGSKKLLGVIFKKGHYENDLCMLKTKDIIKLNQIIFIKNTQYCVFEKNFEEEIKTVISIDLDLPCYSNIKQSFDKVTKKQDFYDKEINKIIDTKNYICNEIDFECINYKSILEKSVQLFNIIQEKPSPKGYDLRKDEYDIVFLEETS